ncbi:metallophosphoesterase [candidate division KSB1 bacterium]|nr:metallophosphoesterase [candidate division KSB1 bacterium]
MDRVNSYKNKLTPFMLIVAAFMLLTLVINCTSEKGHSFRFVFMTDIHVQPELNGDAGYRQAVEKVNQLKPDFVITGGDLIMDALGQSEERARQLYDMYINISNNFAMPVYNTMGNHEVFGLYEKSGISTDHPDYGKQMYRNRLGNGKTYYSFDNFGWHVIVLDGIGFTAERQYIGEVDSEQLKWLREDLQKVNPTTPIIVSTHIPLVSVGEQMWRGGTTPLLPGEVITNSRAVLDLFSGHKLKMVLQGHLHIVEEIIFKDTHYITGGAVSGAWWKGARSGFPEGFVVVDIKKDESFSWHYETFGWQAVAE